MTPIYLQTRKCIVTGRKPRFFTGHVIAQLVGELGDNDEPPIHTIHVIAGFSDDEAHKQVQCDKRGCFGAWQERYGIDRYEV